MEIKRFHLGKTLSEMAVYNGVAYLAGQIAEDTTQGIAGQTRDVLKQIDRLLEQAGSDKTRILMCQIFISDFKNFPGMNTAWNEWVPEGHTPPRATVEAKLAQPEWLLEIVITAAIK
jgi:enamine deaminase RidA (YjgF/YER057c/UK114 family)